MNKVQVKSVIKEWIIRMDKSDSLPENIVALNFGLYEPYGIELIGASNYSDKDDDWACDEDFIPTERNCPELNISKDCAWEDVLANIVDILKELVNELDGLALLSVKHVTTGFCDGDLCVIK